MIQLSVGTYVFVFEQAQELCSIEPSRGLARSIALREVLDASQVYHYGAFNVRLLKSERYSCLDVTCDLALRFVDQSCGNAPLSLKCNTSRRTKSNAVSVHAKTSNVASLEEAH